MAKPTCPRCYKGGYTQGAAPDLRPQFTCTRCGFRWTNGSDGGKYVKAGQEGDRG